MSSRNARPNNAEVVDRCTQRLRALGDHVPTNARIDIDGTAYDARGVAGIYEDALASRAEIATIRASLAEALTRRAQKEAARRAADRALKPWVVHRFGERSAEATAFGFPPPREYHRTVGEKLHSVALAKATRAARWTMGPRQKEKIRGQVAQAQPGPPSPDPSAAAPDE